MTTSCNEGLTGILLGTLGRLGIAAIERLTGARATPLEMPTRVIPGRRVLCGDCGPAELLEDGCCATCGGHSWAHLRHVTLPWDRMPLGSGIPSRNAGSQSRSGRSQVKAMPITAKALPKVVAAEERALGSCA